MFRFMNVKSVSMTRYKLTDKVIQVLLSTVYPWCKVPSNPLHQLTYIPVFKPSSLPSVHSNSTLLLIPSSLCCFCLSFVFFYASISLLCKSTNSMRIIPVITWNDTVDIVLYSVATLGSVFVCKLRSTFLYISM